MQIKGSLCTGVDPWGSMVDESETFGTLRD